MFGWLSVLGFGVDGAIAGVALGPDQEQDVFTCRVVMDLVGELAGRAGGMTIDLEDDVSGLEAGIFCRAGGTDVLYDDTAELVGRVDLLPEVRREVTYGEAKLAALRRTVAAVVGHLGVLLETADGDVEAHRFSVAKDVKGDAGSGRDLAYGNLKRASVDDLLSVDLRDDVALVQTTFAGGGVGSDLRDDGTGCFLQIEEVSVGWCDIVEADAEIAVIDLAVLHQLLGSGTHDLRGDGEASASEGAAVGDDEGVDSHELTVRVDERSAGVAGVDGSVGLDEAAGLAGIIRVRIGTVDGTDDAAGDGELEVAERAAEGKDSLSGMQLAGVAPGDAGEAGRVNLDDSEIGQLVDTDELAGEDAAIVEGDLDVRGAVDDVAVGDDVAVRGDDDSAADAVLDLRLLGNSTAAEELGEPGRETLRLGIGIVGVGGFVLLSFAGDRYVDDSRGDAGGYGFHRLVKRRKGRDAVVVEWRGGEGSSSVHAATADEDCRSQGEAAYECCGKSELPERVY